MYGWPQQCLWAADGLDVLQATIVMQLSVANKSATHKCVPQALLPCAAQH